eukprot:14046918-Alexandrium_andersonii.AAC.1
MHAIAPTLSIVSHQDRMLRAFRELLDEEFEVVYAMPDPRWQMHFDEVVSSTVLLVHDRLRGRLVDGSDASE